jgi:hypothetical protein
MDGITQDGEYAQRSTGRQLNRFFERSEANLYHVKWFRNGQWRVLYSYGELSLNKAQDICVNRNAHIPMSTLVMVKNDKTLKYDVEPASPIPF